MNYISTIKDIIKLRNILLFLIYHNSMKNYTLIIISLFFNFHIFSQELNINFSKYVVTKNNDNFIFISSDKEFIVSTTGQILDSIVHKKTFDHLDYLPFFVDDVKLFVENQGGKVYKFLNQNYLRIDNSFTHKNQLLSSVFIKNDTLFRFGGYGFFEAKNYFTYFSNETKEWEAFQTKSKLFPNGNFNNKYFTLPDYFYFFGGQSVDQGDKNVKISNEELWRYSFVNNSWELLLNNKFFNGKTYSPFDFYYKGKFYFLQQNKLFSLDINTNSVSKYVNLNALDKGNYRFPSIVKNDTLFSIGYSSNNKKYNLFPIPLSTLKIDKNIIKDSEPISYFILLFIFFTILIFSFKNKWFNKKFKLKGPTLSYGFKTIKLLDLESIIFNLLIEGKNIENSKLISSIDSSVDNSQKTRIKNQIIYGLNIKLEILTQNSFTITNKASKNDKRYFDYRLEKTNNSS